MTLTTLGVLAVCGWLLAGLGLRRGLVEAARTPALTAHALTPFGALLVSAVLGFGALFTLIAMTAQWWALLLVTLGRPHRLVDPSRPGPLRPVLWLITTGVLAHGLAAAVV
ncbi:hypothetical protein [Thermomonospora sp. CIF 1]|uniref:hypothetical protein n=1 Tax=Thermomonospora sp. CIF 1 TaxID=1916083 RepID=UPI000CB94D9C|nr:hypothetical protein [Thermomonospora sp. CIF 1]PKK15168.1 MAG: hypothetical protein BUE48_006340 [Thermomonospora sp. CIF 1]